MFLPLEVIKVAMTLLEDKISHQATKSKLSDAGCSKFASLMANVFIIESQFEAFNPTSYSCTNQS